jgi:hypothetical protein
MRYWIAKILFRIGFRIKIGPDQYIALWDWQERALELEDKP